MCHLHLLYLPAPARSSLKRHDGHAHRTARHTFTTDGYIAVTAGRRRVVSNSAQQLRRDGDRRFGQYETA